MNLKDFRKQYPQYDKIDDDTLADALYDKYYAGTIERDDFDEQIGLYEGRGKLDRLKQLGGEFTSGALTGASALATSVEALAGMDERAERERREEGRVLYSRDPWKAVRAGYSEEKWQRLMAHPEVGHVYKRMYEQRQLDKEIPTKREIAAGAIKESAGQVGGTLRGTAHVARENMTTPELKAEAMANRVIETDEEGNITGVNMPTVQQIANVSAGSLGYMTSILGNAAVLKKFGLSPAMAAGIANGQITGAEAYQQAYDMALKDNLKNGIEPGIAEDLARSDAENALAFMATVGFFTAQFGEADIIAGAPAKAASTFFGRLKEGLGFGAKVAAKEIPSETVEEALQTATPYVATDREVPMAEVAEAAVMAPFASGTTTGTIATTQGYLASKQAYDKEEIKRKLDEIRRAQGESTVESDRGSNIVTRPDGTKQVDPSIAPDEQLLQPLDVAKVRRKAMASEVRAMMSPDQDTGQSLARGLEIAPEVPGTQPAPAPAGVTDQDYANVLAGDLELAEGVTRAPRAPTRDTKIPQAQKELNAAIEPTVAGKDDAITAPRAVEEDPFAQKADVYDPLTLAEPGARLTDEKAGQVEYEAQIDTAGLALQEEVAPKAAVDEGKVQPVDEAKIEEVRTRIQDKLSSAPDSAVKSMLSQVGIKQSGTKQERVDRVVAARELFERYGRYNTEAQLRTLFKGEENVKAAELLSKIMPANQAPTQGFGGIGSWQNARNIRAIVNRMGGNIQDSPGAQEAEIEYAGDKPVAKGQYKAPEGFKAQDKKTPAKTSKLKLMDVQIPVRVRETGQTENITYKADEAIAYEDGRIDSLSKLRSCLLS